MIDQKAVLKYKSLGEMAQRSRTGGANYVHLSDYDSLVKERDELSDKLTHSNNLRIEAQDFADKLQFKLDKAHLLFNDFLKRFKDFEGDEDELFEEIRQLIEGQ